MNIIEPCCAERQLPALLREQKGRAVMFQTYGDVTFDNLLKSVSCMAGDNQLTMTLSMTEYVTDKMKRTIKRYQDRGWITEVRLLEGEVEGDAFVFEGAKGVVVIQGTITDIRLGLAVPILYAGQFTTDVSQVPLAEFLASRYRMLSARQEKQTKTNTRKNKKENESTEEMA